MFWIEVSAPVMMCTLTSSRTPEHTEGVLDPVLVVDDELLGKHVQDLLVHGDIHGPGCVDHARHVGRPHFLVLDRHNAAGVDALDVTAGDADIHRVDLHTGHELGLLDRLFDGLHRAVDVHDHAFLQTMRGADADPDDIDLSVRP